MHLARSTDPKAPTRKFTEDTLLLASHNKGKLVELRDLLGDKIPNITSAVDMNLPEPEETGTTFVDNAVLKALACMRESGLPSLADDSGLSVTTLDGAPGVYSARWAGEPRDFNLAMQKVHDAMEDAEDRSASFVCVLALAWPDGHVETFEGRIDGNICWPPRGDKGFGYDPIFVPLGDARSFGEIDFAEKQGMSHRAKAFKAMIDALFPA